eukprot:477536-Amphidinium_carterae.7
MWQGHSVIIRAITEAEFRTARQAPRGAAEEQLGVHLRCRFHGRRWAPLATQPTQLDDPTQDAWATYLEKQGRGKELSKGG